MDTLANRISPVKVILLKLFFIGIVLVLLTVLSVGPASAQAETFKDNLRVPVDIFAYIPCAAGGAGEVVILSGNLHILFVTTIDGQGGFHSKFHFQPQGIRGYGLTTGTKYQSTGVTQGHFNGKVGIQDTFINNFKIIGQGPGNNLLIHETFHVTVNARGQVTASVSNVTIKCQ